MELDEKDKLCESFIGQFEHRHPIHILETLLRDRTTGKNIIWASDEYESLGEGFSSDDEITSEKIAGQNLGVIKPRTEKGLEKQSRRTKNHAEVFTPSWLCNQMNNDLDAVWFGRRDVFNAEKSQGWQSSSEPLAFPKKKGHGWHAYVESPRLEITCGEAPFACSRYDAVTGAAIPVSERIGFLDRKLRAVTEKTKTRKEWIKQALNALSASYGFEYQGDSLLVARINVLETFCDHCEDRWGNLPSEEELGRAAQIISWNFWQMNGLTDAAPTSTANAMSASMPSPSGGSAPDSSQLSFFDLPDGVFQEEEAGKHEEDQLNEEIPLCVIYDWKNGEPFTFASLKEKSCPMDKKFYAVIGNPPYQESVEGNGRTNPIYPSFMDAAYDLGEKVELITPGRFLFDVGQTPHQWNEKMLDDSHLKVLRYEPDATNVFSGMDIKGGVAITYRDSHGVYGPIGTFTAYPELNSIIKRVKSTEEGAPNLASIFASQRLYKLSDLFFEAHGDEENVKALLDSGTRTKILSSFMEKMPHIFLTQPGDDSCIRVLGRIGGKRQWRYVLRAYVRPNDYLDAYKLFIPEANGSGVYGETLAEPVVAKPGEGSSDTFLNAGPFSSEKEAINLCRYYKTRFFRALLGAKKATQHSPAQVWETIPLQDFTSQSDIDWSVSIEDIDRQLYRKYELTDEEIDFIETHVKEME